MQSLARPMLRSPAMRLAARRFESNTAQKAQETAKDTATKAKEGLSRVSSAAGPAIAGYAKGLGNALSKIGGRTGRIIGFVERQVPFVVYYSKVTAEVAKIVFHGQKMSPPSVSTFQSYYQSALKSFQNRTFLQSPQNLLNQARNLSTTQVAAGGVILAECLGFFTVGEMIGRFKLVGYHGETATHH